MTEVLIGLGSNLGDRVENIERALDLIGRKAGSIRELSSFVESEPWGYQSGNWFINRVAVIDFDEAPVYAGKGNNDLHQFENATIIQGMELLNRLREIETSFGRMRTGRYMDRMIDLDILFFGDAVFDTEELTIPHPHLHKRRFIMVSLMELCPDRVHPRLELTIRQLMEKCTDQGLTRIIKDPDHQ